MSTKDTSDPVLTVFQAAPLAYEDYAGNANLLRVLDFETESTMLKETLDDTGIHLKFETATSNSLGSFLSQSNELLHFSGHGHPQYLFIENDYGGGQILLVNEDLMAWIRAGGNSLKFVFVAACHSRSAGEAFVEAGVEHVVCCEKDALLLSDVAAMIFARDFYRALANGRTVQQAYNLAINGVMHAPELRRTGLDPQTEAKKFVLLPEGGSHDISLFPGPITPKRASPLKSTSINGLQSSSLPLPPENFVGRELEMYTVFRSLILKKTRLVSVTGQKGIGKASFAKAIGQYMEKRRMWGDVMWVPSPRQGDEDDVHSLISKVMTIAQKHSDRDALLADRDYLGASEQIFDGLFEKKAVIIIDALKFSTTAIKLLSLFLYDLFERTRHVKVLVLLQQGAVLDPNKPTGFPCSDTNITLQLIDFSSTVFLFGRTCPHAASNDWSVESIANKYHQYTESTFKILGEGIPAKTVILARNMGRPEYEKLVKEGVPIVEADFKGLLSTTSVYDQVNGRTRSTTGRKRSSFATQASEGGGSETFSLSPVRNQKEVQTRFVPLLRRAGKIFRKRVTSFVRRARKGEQIVTAIDGVHESQKTVNDDSSWVVCGKAAGEYYVLTDKEFHESYDINSGKPIPANAKDPQSRRLRQQGFFEYNSKRYIWGRIVDEDDMKYFRHGADTPDFAYFVAPWGETMRVEKGDYLVTQYAPNGKCNDECYRVERIVFDYSYADTEEEQTGNYWWWAAAAIGVAGLAVVSALTLIRTRSRR
jgi:hypothetical protein